MTVCFSKKKYFGALAQLARAPALHAGGQEFDSPRLHHLRKIKSDKIWKEVVKLNAIFGFQIFYHFTILNFYL